MTAPHVKNAVHVELNVGDLSDADLAALGASIAKLAPASSLYQGNATVQSLVGDIATQNVTLATSAAAIVSAEAQLVTMKETRANARDILEKDLTGLRGLVEAKASTVADANAVGLNARVGRAAVTPLVAPSTVTVLLGKVHGRFIARANPAPGTPRGTAFGAQWSPDPVGPATWQDLPGRGKQRVVSGHASGAVVWVRFCALRGDSASAYCAPVSVTVP